LAGVYQLSVRFKSRAGKTHEMLQAIRLVMLPAEFEAGSIGCHLYAEAGEADLLFYVEEWATLDDLEREIRSSRFARLLSVMEAADGLPALEIRDVAKTLGWNYVRLLRGDPSPADEHADEN
jgi:quinol monooxygenase YgiN